MTDSADSNKLSGSGNVDVDARHGQVLGYPQRLAPLERNAESESLAYDYWCKLRRSIYGPDDQPPKKAKIPEIHFTMLRHPELWERISALSVQLSGRGMIPVRDRELVILRTGWLCQAPFEWGEHVRIARGLGLTTDDIERVIEGSAAEGWTEHERALLAAAEELHAGAMVADETFEVLSRTMTDVEFFELTVLIGQFTAVAYWQNALRLPLGEDNAGLEAR